MEISPLPSTQKKPILLTYYKNALLIYFKNLWKFLFIGCIGASVIFGLNILLVDNILPNTFGIGYPYQNAMEALLSTLIGLPISMVANGFYGAILGMAFDIMASGDEFTNIKNAWYYIRKYWFKFFLLGFVVNIFTYALRFIDPNRESFALSVLFTIFSFGLSTYFFIFNSALIYYPNFKNSFTKSNKLWKTEPKISFSAHFIYYAIFWIPVIVIFNFYLFNSPYNSELGLFSRDFNRMMNIIRYLFAYPVMGLVSIRIINEFRYNIDEQEAFTK
jgi:hypothetical protein